MFSCYVNHCCKLFAALENQKRYSTFNRKVTGTFITPFFVRREKCFSIFCIPFFIEESISTSKEKYSQRLFSSRDATMATSNEAVNEIYFCFI